MRKVRRESESAVDQKVMIVGMTNIPASIVCVHRRYASNQSVINQRRPAYVHSLPVQNREPIVSPRHPGSERSRSHLAELRACRRKSSPLIPLLNIPSTCFAVARPKLRTSESAQTGL